MALYTPKKSLASYLERIGYQAGLLGGICALVALLIIFADLSTRERIYEELQNDQRAMLEQVLPPNLYNNNLIEEKREISGLNTLGESPIFYTATKNGEVTGYAFSLSEEGYSGKIKMIIGIDKSGTILGVRVISHTETPGLGDRIEVQRDDWIKTFDGLSLTNTNRTNWAVKKDGGQFDQFTGATITPRAVVKGILNGLEFYSENKGLFTPPSAQSGINLNKSSQIHTNSKEVLP